MNKPVQVVLLCLLSTAVGVFVTLRMVGHSQSNRAAPPPPAPTSAASVSLAARPSRAEESQSKRTAEAIARTPPAATPMEDQGDYDFESLGGAPGQAFAKRFESERRDPNWAPGAMDAVRVELDGQSVSSQLSSLDIDCKVTLCRVQASLPLETLQAMGPNANFSWGGIMSKLLGTPPLSDIFDNISDIESIDSTLGQAQFTTYLHRRPQGAGAEAQAHS